MKQTRHIALLHGGALGDLVLTLRLAAALQQRFAPTHLTLYARVDLSSLGDAVCDVDAFRSFDGTGLHTMFHETSEPDASCIAELSRFDLIVNCLADADAPISRRFRHHLPGRIESISTVPRDTLQGHVSQQWLDDLAAAGLKLPVDTLPRIVLRSDQEKQPGRVALLHPGSGGKEKCWPIERFAQLADKLRQNQIRPYFLIGPVEMDRHGEAITEALSSHATVLANLSLHEAAARIAAADLYVGNDTGMTHLAAAVGTPTIALFGPTDPTLWRPLGHNVTVILFDGVTIEKVMAGIDREIPIKPAKDR
jgi:ADP-heptose:LPS heptosyltransferase